MRAELVSPPRLNRSRPLLLAWLLAGLMLCTAATAQRYEWRDVVTNVVIEPDGSVVVDDVRTLWTDEDFGEAFICLHLGPGESVNLLPGSGAVGPGPASTAFTQPCAAPGDATGTELVVRNSVRVNERRVRFHYRLTGTTEAFRDVVQWYWQILEADHPPVRGYELTVEAPGPMSEPFDAYVHRYSNPEEPQVSLAEDRSLLRVAFEYIADGSGVEINYLMDPALFTMSGSTPGFLAALEEEAEIARVSGRSNTIAALRASPWLAVIPAGIVMWLLSGVLRAYRRHGREPTTDGMKYPFEPPSDLPPAAVTAMGSQRFQASSMGPAFMATIMDLARRGYGEFRPKRGKFEMVLNLDRSTDELLPFEKAILGYLTSAAKTYNRGDDGHLQFNEMKSYSQRYASTFVPKWATSVRNWLESQRGGKLVDAVSLKQANRWAGYGALALAACVLAAVLTTGPGRVASIVGAALSFILIIVGATAIPSWRPEIAREVAGWNGFKRTLTDYTRMKDAPLDFFKLWDVYYVYAAAMGVAEKYLKTVRRAAPLKGIDERSIVSSAHWMGATAGMSSLSDVSRSISSLSSSLASASASASSGGSSSGGGGGGGGGSSGGR